VLEPELDWEKEGSERVGNTFVFYHEKEKKYFLYYSASSQMLPDSKVAEPIYLGLATADDLKGPWTRRSEFPMVVNGLYSIPGEDTTGVGSLKLVKGIEQTYDRLVGLINRITKSEKTGATGSTISMVVSEDKGITWDVIEPNLITPTLVEKNWKEVRMGRGGGERAPGPETLHSGITHSHLLVVASLLSSPPRRLTFTGTTRGWTWTMIVTSWSCTTGGTGGLTQRKLSGRRESRRKCLSNIRRNNKGKRNLL